MANSQVGRQLAVESAPQFTNFTVRGGTWKQKGSGGATKVEMNENADEETFNLTGWDPGIDATCDLFPDAGFTLDALDVLPEINVDNPRTFVVAEPPEKSRFGKRGIV